MAFNQDVKGNHSRADELVPSFLLYGLVAFKAESSFKRWVLSSSRHDDAHQQRATRQFSITPASRQTNPRRDLCYGDSDR